MHSPNPVNLLSRHKPVKIDNSATLILTLKNLAVFKLCFPCDGEESSLLFSYRLDYFLIVVFIIYCKYNITAGTRNPFKSNLSSHKGCLSNIQVVSLNDLIILLVFLS